MNTYPISIEAIVEINQRLTGVECSRERRKLLTGIFSGYLYQSSKQEKIASIVLNILKGHYFFDGNKRTAFAVYLDLCQANDISYVSDENILGDLFNSLASDAFDVKKAKNRLFPED